MPKLPTRTFLALIVALPTLASCNVRSPESTPTPITGAPVPTAISAEPVQTYPPQPVPSGQVYIPPPVPSVGPTHIPLRTAKFEIEPKGDSPDAQEVLNKWRDAVLKVHSVRVSQQFMLVEPDGTRHPIPDDQYNSRITGTDEWYDNIRWWDGQIPRHRIIIHMTGGELITLYDGKAAYRTWSWLNEVYQPWPDVNHSSAYLHDDIDSIAMLLLLLPASGSNTTYGFVGNIELDGRKLVELVVKEGHTWQGTKGTRIYLEQATYLPYRYITHTTTTSTGRGYERTFVKLETNTSVSDADFKLDLPLGVPIVYEATHWGRRMPTYSSLLEAQNNVDYKLFGPKNNYLGPVHTLNLIEHGGTTAPLLSMNVGSGRVLQGTYIPLAQDSARFTNRLNEKLGIRQVTKIDVNSQPAEWHEHALGGQSIRIVREGTILEVEAKTREEAIEIAESLQPISTLQFPPSPLPTQPVPPAPVPTNLSLP